MAAWGEGNGRDPEMRSKVRLCVGGRRRLRGSVRWPRRMGPMGNGVLPPTPLRFAGVAADRPHVHTEAGAQAYDARVRAFAVHTCP